MRTQTLSTPSPGYREECTAGLNFHKDCSRRFSRTSSPECERGNTGPYGDVLVVTKLDRLGRNAMDVAATVAGLDAAGDKTRGLKVRTDFCRDGLPMYRAKDCTRV